MEQLIDIAPWAFAIIAGAFGITELVKRLGLNTKFLPLVSLATSISLSAIYYLTVGGVSTWEIIINGLFAGFIAGGIFSYGKNTIEGFTEGK
jgi:hypothetical protein